MVDEVVGETFCGGEERNDQGILGLSEMGWLGWVWVG